MLIMTKQLISTFLLPISWIWYELDFIYFNVQSGLSPLLFEKSDSHVKECCS